MVYRYGKTVVVVAGALLFLVVLVVLVVVVCEVAGGSLTDVLYIRWIPVSAEEINVNLHMFSHLFVY